MEQHSGGDRKGLGFAAFRHFEFGSLLCSIPYRQLYSPDDLEQAFDAVDAKIEGEATLEERLEYLKCAITLQRRLKAAYLSTGREPRPPSTFCPRTETWSARSHWAENSEEFKLLSAKEKEEAYAADFSTREAPLDFYSIMSLEADDHGAVDVSSRKTEPSLKESLRSAPMMYGVSPSEGYNSALQQDQGMLVAGQKPEGGKQAANKIRLYVTASFLRKIGFRQLDRNARTLTSLVGNLSPGASTSKLTEQIRSLMVTLLEPSRLASSTDISGWSPSQKRESWKNLHSMLASSTGQCPTDWWSFIQDLRYINGSACSQRPCHS